MALPWFRVQTGWYMNPKVAELVSRGRHRSVVAYLSSVSFAVQQETDGHIATAVLPLIHASSKDATDLVSVGLWHETDGGWAINDYLEYQPSKADQKAYRDSRRIAACNRWMREGKPCTCGQH